MFNLLLNFLEKVGLCNTYDMIIPNIYLGNISASQDLDFMKNNNIKLIINCSKDIPFITNYECDKIRVPIDDNKIFKNNDILNHLHVIDKIDEQNKKNQTVLIHCRSGCQRSANIVLLYLMRYKKLDFNSANKIIKEKRPISFFPVNNFNHIY